MNTFRQALVSSSVWWLGIETAAAMDRGQLPRQKHSKVPAPKVRAVFAKRLREQRVKRGYRNARSFAHAIGIEENRYTRYERAEVEPDLTLIERMCNALRITPNDLLGFSESGGLELKCAILRESLRQDGVRLQQLLKQTDEQIGEYLDIVSRIANVD